MMGVPIYRQDSDAELPTGQQVEVRMEFAADAAAPATGGDVTLFINGERAGGGRMDHSVAVRFSGYSGMDIGRDAGLPVEHAYADKSPFAFTGTINKVLFDIDPHLTEEDRQAVHEHAHHGALACGIGA